MHTACFFLGVQCLQQLTLSLILSPLLQVTHLVTPQCQYTPKFLTAIAKLVPVVSPAWLEAAAARTDLTAALPDPNADAFAPKPAENAPPAAAGDGSSPKSGNHGRVIAERAALFKGIPVVAMPGTISESSDDTTRKLIECMGGKVTAWPAEGIGASGTAAWIAGYVAEGAYFLQPAEGEPGASSTTAADVKAVQKAGGKLYTNLSVRSSLIRGYLEAPTNQTKQAKAAPPPAAAAAATTKPSPRKSPRKPSSQEEAPAAAAEKEEEAAAAPPPAKKAKAAPAAAIGETEAAAETEAAPAAETQEAPAKAANNGWGQKKRKAAATAEEPPKKKPTSAAAAPSAEPPATEAEPAEQAAPAPAPPPPAPKPAAPLPPDTRPAAPSGWRKKEVTREDTSYDTVGYDASATSAAAATQPAEKPPAAKGKKGKGKAKETTPTKPPPKAFSGKAFKKKDNFRSGALVQMRTEVVKQCRDKAHEEEAREEEGTADNADNLFEEAIQQGQARAGNKRRR